MIIQYGAGHPRQTLQIINRAFIVAEKEIIDEDSVKKAIEELSNEIAHIGSQEELEVIAKIQKGETVIDDEVYLHLKERNIIFEYSANKQKINPIASANIRLQKLLDSITDDNQ